MNCFFYVLQSIYLLYIIVCLFINQYNTYHLYSYYEFQIYLYLPISLQVLQLTEVVSTTLSKYRG